MGFDRCEFKSWVCRCPRQVTASLWASVPSSGMTVLPDIRPVTSAPHTYSRKGSPQKHCGAGAFLISPVFQERTRKHRQAV